MRREGTDVHNAIRLKFHRSPFRDVGEGEEKLPGEQKLVEFYVCNTIDHFHVQMPNNSDHRDVDEQFPMMKSVITQPTIRKACQCDGTCQSDGWEPDSVLNHHWLVQMALLADFEKMIMFQPDPEPLELKGNGQYQPAERASIIPQAIIQTIVIHYHLNGRECIQTLPVDYRNQVNEMLAVGGGLLLPEPWMAIAGPVKNAHTQMVGEIQAKKTT